jgi:uncharacterized membrane protein YedE/YeeE
MRVRLAAASSGVAFGFLLAWTQMTDPDAIRRMLLLEDAYLFLVMASSIAVGFVALRLLRRLRFRAALTGEPMAWKVARPRPRHVAGSALFGLGWGVSCTCPGPIAAQLGQGTFWSVATIAGVVLGIVLFGRAREHPRLREALE